MGFRKNIAIPYQNIAKLQLDMFFTIGSRRSSSNTIENSGKMTRAGKPKK